MDNEFIDVSLNDSILKQLGLYYNLRRTRKKINKKWRKYYWIKHSINL